MASLPMCLCNPTGEVFDYLVSHGRMKEVEARAKFRQVEKKATPPDDHVLLVLTFNSFGFNSICLPCPHRLSLPSTTATQRTSSTEI